MAFPDGFLDEVRRSADIVRVVEGRVALKKFGHSYKGLCPFHNEKTPSFNVRSEPPLFHCFGCGEGGDVFKFVMLSEQTSFPEAVETLARRFGVPLPDRGLEGPDHKRRELLFAALEAAAEQFQQTLWSNAGSSSREYLLGRGFARETLETIRAGAARDSWDDILGSLRRRFALDVLQEAGLVLARQDGSGHYDRFRNRAVFPILDESGRVCGFGARSLDGSEPKYLNSPESPVYQKSKLLYGLSWAKSAIRQDGCAVLMEGYLDVARAIEHGVLSAVATCGTALTPQHARVLRRHTEHVAVNFDQDAAGQKAAEKSLEVLTGGEALKVTVVELPEGDDPDTYLKARGGAAYRERLAAAPVHMEWLIRRAGASHDLRTPAGKAEYLNALLPALGRVASAVERAAWVPRIAEVGGLDERATAQELRRALTHNTRVAVAAPKPVEVARQAEPQRFEKELLVRILGGNADDVAFLEELHEDEIASLATAELLLAAKGLYMRGVAISATSLQDAIASDAGRRLLAALVLANEPDGAPAEDCLKTLRQLRVQARLREIQQAVRAAQGAQLDALLQEKTDLSRQLAQI